MALFHSVGYADYRATGCCGLDHQQTNLKKDIKCAHAIVGFEKVVLSLAYKYTTAVTDDDHQLVIVKRFVCPPKVAHSYNLLLESANILPPVDFYLTMHFLVEFIVSLAIVGVLAVRGSDPNASELDKPVLNKPIDPEDYHFSHSMLFHLESSPPNTTRVSPEVQVCYDCQNTFTALGYDYNETMELYRVTYPDCGAELWIMCRHTEAPLS